MHIRGRLSHHGDFVLITVLAPEQFFVQNAIAYPLAVVLVAQLAIMCLSIGSIVDAKRSKYMQH